MKKEKVFKNITMKKKKKSCKQKKRHSGSGKLNLRCPNMDCGPPWHPIWTTDNNNLDGQVGGDISHFKFGNTHPNSFKPINYHFDYPVEMSEELMSENSNLSSYPEEVSESFKNIQKGGKKKNKKNKITL